MRNMIQAVVTVGVMLLCGSSASAQAPAGVGTEEFGLTPRQLVQSIEKVEALISKCMRLTCSCFKMPHIWLLLQKWLTCPECLSEKSFFL